MAAFNTALRAWHQMLGLDQHIPWPVGSPSPAPGPASYVTTAPLIGIIPRLTSRLTPSVFADGMSPLMVRGTDIGPSILHAGPPSQTMPIELATSGSKSHFGVSRCRVKDQTGASGCLGVAVFGAGSVNLNCGTPAPTPSGVVFAPATLVAKLTAGDLVAGVYMTAWDYAGQRIMGRLGEVAIDPAAKVVNRIMSRLGAAVLGSVAAREVARVLEARGILGPVARALRPDRARVLASSAEGTRFVLGLAAGSPLGISTGTFLDGPGGSAYNRAADAVDPEGHADDLGRAVDDYFDNPLVDEVPSVPEPADSFVGGVQ